MMGSAVPGTQSQTGSLIIPQASSRTGFSETDTARKTPALEDLHTPLSTLAVSALLCVP